MTSTQAKFDDLWLHAKIITCDNQFSIIEDGVIAIKAGKIAWIGRSEDFHENTEGANIHNANDLLITPGLIDCHTHLVYAGNRANEFAERLAGVSYSDIARRGGGIQATVAATRKASFDELVELSLPRAKSLMQSGVTTLEIKSGYGLNLESEIKILRVAKQLQEILNIDIYTTFLGAHTIPPEYKNKADHYVDFICSEMIPIIAKEKLANAVDVFCENIAFNLLQTEKIFKCAKDHELAIKCHAEQLSSSGAAALAASYNALSVDHLEFLKLEDIHKLVEHSTVAVLLPGAFYFLREKCLPPIKELRNKGVPIAIASDCNPGTSPIFSLLIILNMACVIFNLSITEALQAVTQHAAKALNLQDTHGSLEVNKNADFAVWNVTEVAELISNLGMNPLRYLVKKGRILISS